MSAALPIVLPIFATPFGIVKVPEAERWNAALLALLAARMPQAAGPGLRSSSDDVLEWPDEAVRHLSEEWLRGVYTVVHHVNEISTTALRGFTLQARAHATIVDPDGCMPATNYPMTSWCAIYCVSAPAASTTRADSGMLRLYESRLGTMFQDATSAVMRVPFRTSHYAWRPVAGDMAIFPAALMHEIALLRASEPLVLVTLRLRFISPGQEGFERW